MLTITIPVKNYLRKYLVHKYGDFFCISKQSSLGIHLIELLEKDYDPRNVIKVEADAYFTMSIMEHYRARDGVSIHPNRILDISIYLDHIFKEHLYEFIEIHRQNYGMELPAIRMFLEYFNITEKDLKYETIYRAYKRYKVKKKGQK